MEFIDFSRSFLTFRIDTRKKMPQTVTHKPPFSLNNARIQMECRCQIRDKATGEVQTFFLGASCKTERVGVERDIWTEPNADFAPIFSTTHFMNLKTYARVGTQVPVYAPDALSGPPQSDRQSGIVEETFDSLRIDVAASPGRALESASEIIERVLANRPLVARTRFENEAYAATLDYPIKTINANERDGIFQTDTGPVLLPDLTVAPDRLLCALELAFAAFNDSTWIELLARAPTAIEGNARVYHYSQSIRLEATNEVIERA